MTVKIGRLPARCYSPGTARVEATSWMGLRICRAALGCVFALGEKGDLQGGDRVRVSTAPPSWHYRVPTYLRGKIGTVEKVIEPAAIDNERKAMAAMPGRNATTTASRFG